MFEIYIIYQSDQSLYTFRAAFTDLTVDTQVQEINESIHVKRTEY